MKIHKDGLYRNWYRLKQEYKSVKRAVVATWGGHDPVTNAFVEGCRASPYFVGHALLAYIVLDVIKTGVLICLL